LAGISHLSHFGKGGSRGIFRNKIFPTKSPLPPLYQRGESEGFRPSRNDSNNKEMLFVPSSSNRAASTHLMLSSVISFLLMVTLIKGTLFGGLISTNLFHRSEVVTGSKYPQGAVKFLKETGIPGTCSIHLTGEIPHVVSLP